VIFSMGGMCVVFSSSTALCQSGQTSIIAFGTRMLRLPPWCSSFWRNVRKISLKLCLAVSSVVFKLFPQVYTFRFNYYLTFIDIFV
jgi:hypothetical protein